MAFAKSFKFHYSKSGGVNPLWAAAQIDGVKEGVLSGIGRLSRQMSGMVKNLRITRRANRCLSVAEVKT